MDTLGTAIGTGVSGAIVAAGLRATGEVSVGLAAAFGVSRSPSVSAASRSAAGCGARVSLDAAGEPVPTRSDPPSLARPRVDGSARVSLAGWSRVGLR